MRATEKNLTLTFLAAAALVAFGCSSSEEAPRARESARPTSPSTVDRTVGTLPSSGSVVEPPKAPAPVSFIDGEAAYQAGNYPEARRVFARYTVETPDNPWGHYMLGLSAWKGGDHATAEQAFDEALRLDPDHYRSLFNLSRVLLDERRFDDAIVKLTHLGEIGFDSPELSRLFGRAYHGLGMVDDAVAAYRRAITLDAEDVWSMNNLGFLYLEQGRPYDALPALARAVELKPDVPVFHNNLGMALEHTGRFTAAATEYGGALEADPGYAKAQTNLARVQAVKVNGEEPFDLAATAKRFADEFTVAEVVVEETPTVGEITEEIRTSETETVTVEDPVTVE